MFHGESSCICDILLADSARMSCQQTLPINSTETSCVNKMVRLILGSNICAVLACLLIHVFSFRLVSRVLTQKNAPLGNESILFSFSSCYCIIIVNFKLFYFIY